MIHLENWGRHSQGVLWVNLVFSVETVCRRCDGTIQEVDLAEDLMVDGETYECVNSFCYLGDTLDGDGVADFADTARIRNGWMKFRESLPFLTSRAPPLEMKGRVYASCVRSSMTYGSETRPLLVDVGLKFERAEMQMIRWICGMLFFAFQSIFISIWVSRLEIAEFPDSVRRSAPQV